MEGFTNFKCWIWKLDDGDEIYVVVEGTSLDDCGVTIRCENTDVSGEDCGDVLVGDTLTISWCVSIILSNKVSKLSVLGVADEAWLTSWSLVDFD